MAWSGSGKVSKVEVSADGGESWAEAELQSPVLEKCFTRFRIPWQWDGSESVLKSRVTDESGVEMVAATAMTYVTDSDGKYWGVVDSGLMMQQLGVIPED